MCKVSVEKPSEAEGHNSFEKALTIPLRSPQKQRATIPFKPLSFSLFCFNTRNLLSLGGGINSDNSLQYIEDGASHVIVTSYVFNNGQNLERLKDLVRVVGKERLVLDLSCRKREGKYAIVTDRWQKFSDVYLDKEILDFLMQTSFWYMVSMWKGKNHYLLFDFPTPGILS
ncbi:1-(5-phosphoribosyl)-5-((5-phosphoribosylamino)methylideneamino)imidazole-4-carboxamide isomerase [Rosa chinensis]|uniref:1-(5-phosphoribosyl)-5-((5-phosphoribosylamino)methylideneamino)imidazole-4-carboxamide isomerase n=1 Tax=Rosa chinensis TaxID=74649 RepID=A0A2P6SFZ8_ROSCH|nr:1-(5-phosphoribosyl)-5-((5-phosphoribosylamino)methylideneamino)imidazole-4-carboxamide isomerase [Rosa chinensis]